MKAGKYVPKAQQSQLWSAHWNEAVNSDCTEEWNRLWGGGLTQTASPRVHPQRSGPFLNKKYLQKVGYTMVQILATTDVEPDAAVLERHDFRLRESTW